MRSPVPTAHPRWRRVLLVGFMGSGKSTVARVLAERLGWSFLDLDDLVEHWAGMSVESIFETWGEARFRDLEQAVAAETLALQRVVLAPGGGWAAVPGRLETLPEGTLAVWLRVSPAEAVRRVREEAGRPRPLLQGPDPERLAGTLLAARSAFYGAAALHVDTDGASPGDVANAILSHMSTAVPPGL